MDFNAFKREDEEEKLLEKCLFVDERHLENEEEEEEIPAASGEDYLRKVVREGRKFQGTLICKIFMDFGPKISSDFCAILVHSSLMIGLMSFDFKVTLIKCLLLPDLSVVSPRFFVPT